MATSNTIIRLINNRPTAMIHVHPLSIKKRLSSAGGFRDSYV